MHVGLFDTQDNLPGNSDSIEEVVDEAHVVDECVHVTGAQHQQCGQTLGRRTERPDCQMGGGLGARGGGGEGEKRRGTHGEEQSRDGSAAFDVNHGQQTGEVSLSGSSKEQPATNHLFITREVFVGNTSPPGWVGSLH